MTKTDLIELIAQRSQKHYSASVCKVVITAVLDTLADVVAVELSQGNDVPLPGIGKLKTVLRAARTGRNPASGEAMEIPAKNVPHFSAAKVLKDAVA